jgi:hypothetical protein
MTGFGPLFAGNGQTVEPDNGKRSANPMVSWREHLLYRLNANASRIRKKASICGGATRNPGFTCTCYDRAGFPWAIRVFV